MQVISVNIGQEQPITYPKKTGLTGIFKTPIDGPAQIERGGLRGDSVIDAKNHGGIDQAVYIYGTDDYAWWSAELGRELAPGTFGENLTIAGLESALFSVGDRLHAGTVALEVTAARLPCDTLAARMGDPSFIKRFRRAERPGLFCRVVREGQVAAGDPVQVVPYVGETLTIGEMFRSFYDRDPDEAIIRRHLAAPIAIRARAEQERRLRKLLAGRATPA